MVNRNILKLILFLEKLLTSTSKILYSELMKYKAQKILAWVLIFFIGISVYAEKTLVEDNVKINDLNDNSVESSKRDLPKVGRAAAQKYFVRNGQENNDLNARLLSLHIGGSLKSRAQRWGEQSQSSQVGVESFGVTYKIGEWVRTMDLNLRIDYFKYEVDRLKPIKISFLPLLTFPDAGTNFPLYFGMGAGPGVFLRQLDRESNLTLDVQLIFGLRWTDLWNQGGVFIESGIKDHFHLLSDGQFTSQFLTAGAVFRL